MSMPYWKYRPYATVDLPDRTWPDRVVDRAPSGARPTCETGTRRSSSRWTRRASSACSTCSSALGVKEIEVGFPSASKTDFDFVRRLVDEEPDPRRHDDRRADAGAAGADRAHATRRSRARSARSCTSTTRPRRRSAASSSASTRTGSPTSPCAAPSSARSSPAQTDDEIVFEYSPESFHGTELDYALEICEAVIAESGPDARARR